VSIEVEGYDNYAGERRVRVCLDRARVSVLSTSEARDLRDQLDAALRDPVETEVSEMFDECPAATHGPRNSRCTCEDSRDE
jgi:Rad3-related DNA helicase